MRTCESMWGDRFRRVVCKAVSVFSLYRNISLLGKVFNETFQGRTVAVVGGAPNTVGKNWGAIIDSHDLVVRINLLTSLGREGDLGNRTDIRFIGCTLLDAHDAYWGQIEKTSYLMTTTKNIEFFSRQGQSATFYHRDLPQHVLGWLRAILSNADSFPRSKKPPRSGLVFLYLLLKYGKPSSVRLYGFSTADEEAMAVVDYKGGGVIPYDPSGYKNNHLDPSFEVKALRNLELAKLIQIQN